MLDHHFLSSQTEQHPHKKQSPLQSRASTVHGLLLSPPSFSAATSSNHLHFTMSNHNAQTFNWRFDSELDDDRTLQIRGRKLFFIIALFSIILLFVTIFLCARWIFRNRSVHPRHAPAHASNSSSPSQGLDADAIKKLPIILHQAEGSNRALEETECCICLSAFRDGEKLKVLPVCDHCFHCECVDEWLANHSSCPLCRASLKLDSSFPSILIQEPPIRYNLPV